MTANINPPSQTYDFGYCAVGEFSDIIEFTIQNDGDADTTVTSITYPEGYIPAVFVVGYADGDNDGLLGPGRYLQYVHDSADDVVEIAAQFRPNTDGDFTDTFELTFADGESRTYTFTGTTTPTADHAFSHDFGPIEVGTVSDIFRAEITIPDGVSTNSFPGNPFDPRASNISFSSPAGTYYLDIRAAPIAEGQFSGTWDVVLDDGDTFTYTFTATGYVPVPVFNSPHFMVELGIRATVEGEFVLDVSELDGTDVLGGELSYEWVDVTGYVVPDTLQNRRGVSRSSGPWWSPDVGTLSLTLDDNDGSGQFNPLNLTGRFAPDGVTLLGPGMPIRVNVVTLDGLAEPQWRGWVDTWEPAFGAVEYTTVEVTAQDSIERLQAANLPALPTAVGAGETMGQRITRILDRVEWPTSDRDIDMSVDGTTMQATVLGQAAWADILLTSDSDAGLVWVARDGRITTRRRASLPDGVQLTFSAVPEVSGEEFASPKTSWDREQVINTATITRLDGTPQTSTNEVSAALNANGPRGIERTDLICETDEQAREIADWVVGTFSDLQFRVESIVVELLGESDSDDRWLRIARLDIGDRINIVMPTNSGITFTQEALIRGKSWDHQPGTVKPAAYVTLDLQFIPAFSGDPFTLDISELDGPDVLTDRF